MARQQRASLREHHRALAAGALDHALADERFQRGNLMAHRRLRVAQTLGGTNERAFLGDRLEGDQVTQLEPGPIMQLQTISHDTSALDKYLVQRDAGCMEIILIVITLLVLDVLAARFGHDSRVLDPRDPRGWWPR